MYVVDILMIRLYVNHGGMKCRTCRWCNDMYCIGEWYIEVCEMRGTMIGIFLMVGTGTVNWVIGCDMAMML